MRKLPNFLVRPYTKFFLLVLALVIFFALVIVLSSQETTETEDTSALIAGSPVTFDTNKLSAKIKNSIQTGTYIEENDSLQKQLSATSKNNYTNKSNSTKNIFSSTNNGSIKQKVLVIIYDTHNLPVHNTYDYNDPIELTNLLEKAMQVASKERGFLNNGFSTENVDIQIVDTIRYESRAPQIPGTTIPNYRTFDYIKMLNTHSICNRVNNGEVDEVWLWADRTGGFAEALMAGPSNQIFHTNGQPFVKKDCNRAIHIMGFNYERWVDQAVHSMGHRGESVLSVFLDNTLSEKPGDNSYEYMGVQSPYTPGEGWVYCVGNKNYIGNIHCPPNSQFQYKYAEPDVVNSDLKDWYPQHIGIKSTISSSTWNQSHLKYLVQWFQNFPSKEYAPYLTKINGEPMIDMWTAFYKNQFLVPPKIYRCNTICTQDSECSNANSNWFCAQQYNYGSWNDDSSYLGTIQYTQNGQVKTETGTNYGLNQQVRNGVIEQHLVKNNKIFFRSNTPGVGWSSWTDQTANVANVGCNLFSDCGGSIVGFNTYIKSTGKIEQHLLRRNATSFKMFSRNNDNGWSSWADVTNNVSNVGSGTFTSFTSYVHPDGYTLQNIVRGGVLWERTNLGGWKPWGISNGLNSCTGTGSNKCGNTTLLSLERSTLSDGREVLHIFREGNKNYSRTSTPTEQRCRSKTNIFSSTCN